MATADQIKLVQELLDDNASTTGWDSTRIGEDLDAGLSAYRIAEAYWTRRAATTAHLTSISESGSSRSLREIHTSAVAMADRFMKLRAAEDAAEVPVVDTSRGAGIRTFPIRRIAR